MDHEENPIKRLEEIASRRYGDDVEILELLRDATIEVMSFYTATMLDPIESSISSYYDKHGKNRYLAIRVSDRALFYYLDQTIGGEFCGFYAARAEVPGEQNFVNMEDTEEIDSDEFESTTDYVIQNGLWLLNEERTIH